ncbi:protein phosphatase 2C domain-containing protein [Halobaculum sp. EA56]|uniref:protein phosphatase 2C domain-containing protein n=1 Tax=Halobaculum sp. EA56 TaxID=3421648 RepID=UPI003EB8DE7F
MIDRTAAVTDAGTDPNEDTVGYTDAGCWVFDGATGLKDVTRTPAKSDARWYVHALEREVCDRLASDASLTEIAADAIQAVRARYREFDGEFPPDRVDRPAAAGMIVRWRPEHLDLFGLADCLVVIRYEDGRVSTLTDDRLRPFETAAIEVAHGRVLDGRDIATARQSVLPMLRETRSLLNTPDGYWAFGLIPQAADHAVTMTLDRSAVDDVLVCSDGFVAAVDTYDCVPNWEALISTVATHGLTSVVDRIRAVEERDVECRRFPRLKPSDDASALYLDLSDQ